jgi:hypothetical protein
MSLALVAGCAATSVLDSSPERARAVAYAPPGPPKLTLVTVVNNRTGSGGHTALIVSGSEQVVFDPAGSFKHNLVPERGDVLYGMTPSWIASYKSAHARSAWHVVTQEMQVSQTVAEQALKLVRTNGAVAGSFCTNSTSKILSQLPGFENIRVTFFPVNLMDQIAQRPGVVTDKYYENDEGDVRDGIVAAQL